MSAIGAIIVGAAAKIGAPIVKSIIEQKIGGKTGQLAGTVIDAIAEKAGVEPDQLGSVPEPELHDAIQQVEAETPELIALWEKGLAGQFALLQAESKEGFWQSAWRWGWMYFLGVLWAYALLVHPVANALGAGLDAPDKQVTITLTGWFLGLYMGGHTVKELGKQAVEAVKTWKKA